MIGLVITLRCLLSVVFLLTAVSSMARDLEEKVLWQYTANTKFPDEYADRYARLMERVDSVAAFVEVSDEFLMLPKRLERDLLPLRKIGMAVRRVGTGVEIQIEGRKPVILAAPIARLLIVQHLNGPKRIRFDGELAINGKKIAVDESHSKEFSKAFVKALLAKYPDRSERIAAFIPKARAADLANAAADAFEKGYKLGPLLQSAASGAAPPAALGIVLLELLKIEGRNAIDRMESLHDVGSLLGWAVNDSRRACPLLEPLFQSTKEELSCLHATKALSNWLEMLGSGLAQAFKSVSTSGGLWALPARVLLGPLTETGTRAGERLTEISQKLKLVGYSADFRRFIKLGLTFAEGLCADSSEKIRNYEASCWGVLSGHSTSPTSRDPKPAESNKPVTTGE